MAWIEHACRHGSRPVIGTRWTGAIAVSALAWAIAAAPAQAELFTHARAVANASQEFSPNKVDEDPERAEISASAFGATGYGNAEVISVPGQQANPLGFIVVPWRLKATARATGAGTFPDEAGGYGQGQATLVENARLIGEVEVVQTIFLAAVYLKVDYRGSASRGISRVTASLDAPFEEDVQLESIEHFATDGQSFSGTDTLDLIIQTLGTLTLLDGIVLEVQLSAETTSGGAGASSFAEIGNGLLIGPLGGFSSLTDEPSPLFGLSFEFFDVNGNYVNGVSVVGESGAVYPVNGVIVPEPSAIFTAAAAMLVLLIQRLSRRASLAPSYTGLMS